MELAAKVCGLFRLESLEEGSSGVKGRTVAAGGVSCFAGSGRVWLCEGGRGLRPCALWGCWLWGLAFGKVPVLSPVLPYGTTVGPLGLVGTGGGTLTGAFGADWRNEERHAKENMLN